MDEVTLQPKAVADAAVVMDIVQELVLAYQGYTRHNPGVALIDLFTALHVFFVHICMDLEEKHGMTAQEKMQFRRGVVDKLIREFLHRENK